MDKFSPSTKTFLKHYVYQLRDSRNQEVFYIGRGKNDRVFNHVKNSLNKNKLEIEKSKRINQIESDGGKVIEQIVAHSLNEKEAMVIESTLIKSYTLKKLTNQVHGYQGNVPIDVKEIEISISKPITYFPFNALFLKINRLWNDKATEEELHDAIRGFWRLNKKNFYKIQFIIGVTNGISRVIVQAQDKKLYEAGKKENFKIAPRQNEFYNKKFKGKYFFIVEKIDQQFLNKYLNVNFIKFVGNFRSSKRYYFSK
jgi:hypothetical protein